MQFNFGKNWKEFSENALSVDKIEHAKIDFKNLLGDIEIKDKKFIDIGFGQGLSLLIATELGTQSVGVDINPLSREIIKYNKQKFNTLTDTEIPVVIGSILDQSTIDQLQQYNQFDIVHSWGVLHHTGKMWEAIDNTIKLVKPKGHFILAIYNRHWSSKPWLFIKWLYNISPNFLKKLYIYTFFPVIFLAKLIVTGKNPLKKSRGMDFFYDIIDWVGGYPYEYASKKEIDDYMKDKGFVLKKFIEAEVPTGCNEFLFENNQL